MSRSRRAGRLARILVGVAAASATWSVASAGPAVADDCSTLVQDVGDLADEYKMQDCLRTGNNWGRVVGTVVGGAGIAIALVGIRPSRPPIDVTPPSDPTTTVQAGDPPCAEVNLRARRVWQLIAARKRLEGQIVGEWKAKAEGARVLTTCYRDLKEIQWKIAQAKWAATTFNAAWLGMWFCALGPMLRAGATAMSTGWAAVTARANVWFWGHAGGVGGIVGDAFASFGAEAGLAPAAAATETAVAAGAGVSEAFAAGYAGATSMFSQFLGDRLPSYVPSPKPTADFTGEEVFNALVDLMRPVFAQYQEAARAYNRAFGQWATDRQQDLDAISREIEAEVARLNAAAQQCGFAQVPDFGPQGGSATTLHIIQVPEHLGETWLFGSTF
jgi:hypothetical protein